MMNRKDERYKAQKFGKLRKDGTLEVPNRLTLKWILPYYFRMTEKQVVLAMYALTALFCIIGFAVPGEQAWEVLDGAEGIDSDGNNTTVADNFEPTIYSEQTEYVVVQEGQGASRSELIAEGSRLLV
jgi:hypothetical protein